MLNELGINSTTIQEAQVQRKHSKNESNECVFGREIEGRRSIQLEFPEERNLSLAGIFHGQVTIGYVLLTK
jgi:hypothetical protein